MTRTTWYKIELDLCLMTWPKIPSHLHWHTFFIEITFNHVLNWWLLSVLINNHLFVQFASSLQWPWRFLTMAFFPWPAVHNTKLGFGLTNELRVNGQPPLVSFFKEIWMLFRGLLIFHLYFINALMSTNSVKCYGVVVEEIDRFQKYGLIILAQHKV